MVVGCPAIFIFPAAHFFVALVETADMVFEDKIYPFGNTHPTGSAKAN